MNKYIEQAYYLGYQDGNFDGYHSTLIEEGLCDRKDSTDELPNMDLVSLGEVMEIIAEEDQKRRTELGVAYDAGSITVADRIRDRVLALMGGEHD